MVRKSLLAVLLLAIASPLAAQDEYAWSSKRPDAAPPFGVLTAQMLAKGEFQLTYRYHQANAKGVWYGSDSLYYADATDYFPVVPLVRRNKASGLTLAFAPTDGVTLMATMDYAKSYREYAYQDTSYNNEAGYELGDLQVTGLFSVYDKGAYRARVELGGIAPTGTYDVRQNVNGTSVRLPYDMRPGSGVFGVVSGLTLEAQNEVGTVGAQAEGTFRFGRNDLDYSPGNEYGINTWASYRINDFFAVSARGHYVKWESIRGADPNLDDTTDPGNVAYWSGGHRFDVPVGLTVLMPEGTRLAGNRLSVEWIFPVSQHYEYLSMGADWALVAGWQITF